MYPCSHLFVHIDGDVQYTQSIDMIIIVGRGVSGVCHNVCSSAYYVGCVCMCVCVCV